MGRRGLPRQPDKAVTLATKIPTKPTAFPLSRGQKKRPREFAADHLDFVRRMPCCIANCHNPAQAAHIRMGAMMYGKPDSGTAEKPSDKYAVPLCEEHHLTGRGAQHRIGERAFWKAAGIECVILSALLWQVTGDDDAGRLIVENARNLSLWTGGIR